MLELLNTILHKSLPIIEISLGDFIPSVPVLIELRAEQLLGDHEGPQSLISQIIARLIDHNSLVGLYFALHYCFCTL